MTFVGELFLHLFFSCLLAFLGWAIAYGLQAPGNVPIWVAVILFCAYWGIYIWVSFSDGDSEGWNPFE